MLKETITILNKHGLHARPASILVKTLTKFNSEVKLIKDGMEVNGKSIMGVMMLAAERGSTLDLEINGNDENEVLEAIRDLIANDFYEDN